MKQTTNSNFKSSFWPSFLATLVFGLLLALLFINGGNKNKTTDDVFYNALSNQLGSPYSYRSKEANQGRSSQSETTAINMSSPHKPVSGDYIKRVSKVPGKESDISMRVIGTLDADYISYIKVDGKNKEKAQDVIGKWAVNKGQEGKPAEFLPNTIFSTPIMVGLVEPKARSVLVADMQRTNATGKAVAVRAVDTTHKENGKIIYKYDTEINLLYYIPIFKKYLSEIGLQSTASEFSGPESDSKLPITIFIDPAIGKIVKTESSDEGITTVEYFTASKYVDPPAVPGQAKLTFDQLQRAIIGE